MFFSSFWHHRPADAWTVPVTGSLCGRSFQIFYSVLRSSRHHTTSVAVIGPGRRVPKSYCSCCSSCCWNQFSRVQKSLRSRADIQLVAVQQVDVVKLHVAVDKKSHLSTSCTCLDACATKSRQFINIHWSRVTAVWSNGVADMCTRRLEWPDGRTELLIDMLEKNECLWKTTSKSNVNRNMRQKALTDTSTDSRLVGIGHYHSSWRTLTPR